MQNAQLCTWPSYLRNRYITKTLMIMQWTIIFFLAAFLQVSAKGLSQTVTYSGKNVPLKTVFEVVKQQTGYVFFYDDIVLEKAKLVSITAERQDVHAFLSLLLNNQPLKYVIENNAVVITEKEMNKPSLFGVKEAPPITGKITDGQGKGNCGCEYHSQRIWQRHYLQRRRCLFDRCKCWGCNHCQLDWF